MSNSIRRPRKRPRVTSCNFRALWWLVRMEAAFLIRCPWARGAGIAEVKRQIVLEAPSTRWARAYRTLDLNDARRYYP